MRAPRLALAAAVVLALEALALIVVVVNECIQLFRGEATEVSTGLALIVLTAIGAAALAAFSLGVARGRSWARSGAIVLHVLAVVIAIASLTTEMADVALDATVRFALVIGIPGILGFILLVASARAEGRAEFEAAHADDEPDATPEDPAEKA